MARDQKKYVTLYHPGGSAVEVDEDRAEVLKGRGYTTSKPRQNRTKGPGFQREDPAVAELRAENERLQAELTEMKSAGSGTGDNTPAE